LRQAFDGVTFFGCKKSIKHQLNGATGGILESSESKTDKEIVNDFIIPVGKKEDK
jgi:predicted component of type VI protein secretion system